MRSSAGGCIRAPSSYLFSSIKPSPPQARGDGEREGGEGEDPHPPLSSTHGSRSKIRALVHGIKPDQEIKPNCTRHLI